MRPKAIVGHDVELFTLDDDAFSSHLAEAAAKRPSVWCSNSRGCAAGGTQVERIASPSVNMGTFMNYDAWISVAGRLLIASYFIMSLPHGILNGRAAHHIKKLGAFGVPLPVVTFWIGWIIELVGCVLLVANWHLDIGIYCLAVFTIVSNGLYNRYWTVTDPMVKNFSRLLFFANNAVLGGLLVLLAAK